MNQFDIPQSYFDAIKKAESGGNPNAKARTSSASGLYQFTRGTWEGLGFKWTDVFDPNKQEAAIRTFTQSNASVLSGRGINIDGGSLYGAHFLGAGTAARVFGASGDTPLSSILSPSAMKANSFLQGWNVDTFKKWATKKGGGLFSNSVGGSGIGSTPSATSILGAVGGGGDTSNIVGEATDVASKFTQNLAVSGGNPLVAAGMTAMQVVGEGASDVWDKVIEAVKKIFANIIEQIGKALEPWISRGAVGILGLLLIAGALIIFAAQSGVVEKVATVAAKAAL